MRSFALATAVLCVASSAYAADAKIGNLKIDDVWARTGQPGQVSAAYMEIKNKGDADKISPPTVIAPKQLNCTT